MVKLKKSKAQICTLDFFGMAFAKYKLPKPLPETFQVIVPDVSADVLFINKISSKDIFEESKHCVLTFKQQEGWHSIDYSLVKIETKLLGEIDLDSMYNKNWFVGEFYEPDRDEWLSSDVRRCVNIEAEVLPMGPVDPDVLNGIVDRDVANTIDTRYASLLSTIEDYSTQAMRVLQIDNETVAIPDREI